MTAEQWYAAGATVPIDGRQIFVQQAGAGPALLCLHGFPSSSWDFVQLWPELTTRFTALAPDLIGLGRSAKPRRQALTIALQAESIEQLLVELDIESAHILAHDLGDTVAQELLARQREGRARIEWLSCVLLNGGLFPETHQPRPIQRLLLSPLGPLVALLTTEKAFRRNMYRIFSADHPPSPEFLRATWQLIKANRGKAAIPRLIRYMHERVTYRERWVAPLVEGTVPIRLINGTQDPISGRHMAERFAELVPDSDVVLLEAAGHYPHLEVPQQVLAAFHDFHDQLDPA
jgi:pimeloyl-ACP methyl ester carboxylesterase